MVDQSTYILPHAFQILCTATLRPVFYDTHTQPRFLLFRRGNSTDSLERCRLRGSVRRDVLDTEGRHIHHPKELAVIEAQRNRHQHPPQEHSAHPVATPTHENFRGDKPGPDTTSPQSGEGRRIKAPRAQEQKASGSGGLAKDAIVPGLHEGIGSTPAPAFGDALGDALGDPRDEHRRNKVRWGLRFCSIDIGRVSCTARHHTCTIHVIRGTDNYGSFRSKDIWVRNLMCACVQR